MRVRGGQYNASEYDQYMLHSYKEMQKPPYERGERKIIKDRNANSVRVTERQEKQMWQ